MSFAKDHLGTLGRTNMSSNLLSKWGIIWTMQTSKKCPRCLQILPMSEFYFHKKTGRPISKCKTCSKEVRREFSQSEKGKAAYQKWYSTVDKAERMKKQQEYRKTETGKAVMSKYEKSEKGKTKTKRYSQKDQAKIKKRAALARRMANPEYREMTRAYWRKKNAEESAKKRFKKYITSQKGKIRKLAKDRQYKKSPLGLESAKRNNAKRKRLLANAECTLTFQEWTEIQKAQNHLCFYCKKPMEKPTQDHVIPVSRGGNHTKENVVAACLPCNLKKGNRLIGEIQEAF